MRTRMIDFHNANRWPKTDQYCIACQKDIKGEPRFYVHGIEGSAVNVLHPGDEAEYVSDGGDLGFHPIGPNCAKRLGLEWCHRV